MARLGGFGRRRLLGLGIATGVGVAGALVPSADRYASHLLAIATGADAIDRLQAAAAAYLAGAQSLTLDGATWTFDRQPLGLALTLVPAAIDDGLLPFRRPAMMLAATVDLQPLAQALNGIPGLDRPPVEAHLALTGVTATVTPDQPGRRLDLEALAAALTERALLLDDSAVALPMVAIPAETTAADLDPTAAWLDRVLARPLVLHDTPLPAPAIAAALEVEPTGTVAPDRAAWARLLAPLARAVALEPVEPTLRLRGGRAEVSPPTPGRTLDIAATIEAAWAALRAEQPSVAPILTPVPAHRTVADLSPAADVAGRLISRPPVLTAGDALLALTPTDIERLVRPDLSADPAVAGSLVDTLASRADQAPRLPFLRWRDGQAIAEGEGTPGHQLDRPAALAALAVGLRRGDARIELPMVMVPALASPADLSFPDVLAEGRTFYGDSARERYANVALGLNRINGALVPPGGAFSFNQASGPVTYSTGFQKGYGIAISNGQVTTMPSVGGGICQVATTVFHAAFRAGMPIADRSWHLYWMPRYGRAPSGMVGLDATVDDQSGLDFSFVNATDSWLLVEAASDGGDAVVRLRGTDPSWHVAIEGPFISNIVRASQTMTERKDPSLRRGTRVWVEHAEDGKTVSITRTVRDNRDATIDQRTFVSRYAPAANVTLIGTG